MTDKPTGVFVRFPLSDERREVFITEMDCGAEAEQAIRAIGTPVTGGDLKVVAYDNITSRHLSRVQPCGANINLVRQSDAQAQIAALEADMARKDQRIAELEGELSGFRAELSELIAKEVADLKGGAE